MKLELKHLAPYLPYKVEVEFKRNIYPKKISHEILTINTLGLCESSPLKFSIKPLLLPMSSLYTEMEDGKVPIVELAKMATGDLKYCNDLHWVVGGKKEKYAMARKEEYEFAFDYDGVGAFWITQRDVYDGSCPEIEIRSQLDLFTYLFENNFDVYGLIDKELAIDKTKIK